MLGWETSGIRETQVSEWSLGNLSDCPEFTVATVLDVHEWFLSSLRPGGSFSRLCLLSENSLFIDKESTGDHGFPKTMQLSPLRPEGFSASED